MNINSEQCWSHSLQQYHITLNAYFVLIFLKFEKHFYAFYKDIDRKSVILSPETISNTSHKVLEIYSI